MFPRVWTGREEEPRELLTLTLPRYTVLAWLCTARHVTARRAEQGQRRARSTDKQAQTSDTDLEEQNRVRYSLMSSRKTRG